MGNKQNLQVQGGGQTASTGYLMGILSLSLSWLGGVLGVIFGVIGLVRSSKGIRSENPDQARQAKTGRLLSIIGLIVSFIFIFIWLGIGALITNGVKEALTINSARVTVSEKSSSRSSSSMSAADAMDLWKKQEEGGIQVAITSSQGTLTNAAVSIQDDHTLVMTMTLAQQVDPAAAAGMKEKLETSMKTGIQTDLIYAESIGIQDPQVLVRYVNPDGGEVLSFTLTKQ